MRFHDIIIMNSILRLDKDKIASEELLDGKFLVSTSNMSLDAADVAMGYK